MRLHGVRRQLDSIRRQLGRDRRQIRDDQLRQYAIDGTLPEDGLTLAYLRLTEAAMAMMDSSIGGEGYEAAVEAYRQAEQQYQQVIRGVSL